jgi:hypothetical protein
MGKIRLLQFLIDIIMTLVFGYDLHVVGLLLFFKQIRTVLYFLKSGVHLRNS